MHDEYMHGRAQNANICFCNYGHKTDLIRKNKSCKQLS